MGKEEGTIVRVEGPKAWVVVRRSSACNHCGSKESCVSLEGGKSMESEVLNPLSGQVGDRVILKIPTGSVLKLSFLVYVFPILAFILGAVYGVKFGKEHGMDPDLVSFLMGFSTSIVSFFVLKLIERMLMKKKEYIPEIERIIIGKERELKKSGCQI
jgi:sigma-E factor negative regulatory protein RseC